MQDLIFHWSSDWLPASSPSASLAKQASSHIRNKTPTAWWSMWSCREQLSFPLSTLSCRADDGNRRRSEGRSLLSRWLHSQTNCTPDTLTAFQVLNTPTNRIQQLHFNSCFQVELELANLPLIFFLLGTEPLGYTAQPVYTPDALPVI